MHTALLHKKQQHQQQNLANTNISSSSANSAGNNSLSSSPTKNNKFLLSNFFGKNKHTKTKQSRNDSHSSKDLQVYFEERRKSTISGNKHQHQQGHTSVTDRNKSFRIIEEDFEYRSKDPRKKSVLSNRERDCQNANLVDENNFFIEEADVDHKNNSCRRNTGENNDDITIQKEKSEKQKQALKIVRTIGQAFEVSHQRIYSTNTNTGPEYEDGYGYGDEYKTSSDSKNQPDTKNVREDTSKKDQTRNKTKIKDEENGSSNMSDYFIKQNQSKLSKNGEDKNESLSNYIDSSSTIFLDEQSQNQHYSSSSSSSHPVTNIQDFGRLSVASHPTGSPSSSTTHEIQLLHEKLEQQTISTESAIGQIHCLREQLQIEINARIEAQTRAHQLLLHNKELLNHLQMLVKHVKALEKEKEDSKEGKSPGGRSKSEQSTSKRLEGEKSIFNMAQLKLDDYKAVVDSIAIPPMSSGSTHITHLNDENQQQLQKKSNLTLLSRSVSEKLPSKTVQIVCESDKSSNKKGYWSRHTTK